MTHTAASARRLAWAIALTAVFQPVAARAELPLPVAAAITLCLSPGPDRAARTATLAQAGFALLAPTERATAVAAVVPTFMVTRFAFTARGWEDDPTRNAERLASAIRAEQNRAEQQAIYEDVFTATLADHDSYLRISYHEQADRTQIANCTLALPPGDWADALGQVIGTPPTVLQDEVQILMHEYWAEDSRDRSYLISLPPIAFGGTATLPQAVLPPVLAPF